MIRILISLILALCIPAYAGNPDTLKLDRPVIDQAEILSDAQEAALATRLRGWYDDGLMQAAVVIVDSTDDIPLKDYSQALFARWQLGDASRNDGLLILIAHRDHRLRIQPGRGLDDILSTDRLQDIINTRITPAFKRGDYAGGIDSGLDAIVSRLTAPPPITQRDYNFFLLTLVCTCVLGWHLGKRRRFRIYIPPLCGAGWTLFGIFYGVNSGLVFGSVILLILGSTILAWLRIALGKARTNTADSFADLGEADDDNDDGNDGDDVDDVDKVDTAARRRERRDDSDSYRSTYSSSDSGSSSYDGGGGSSSDSGGADGSW